MCDLEMLFFSPDATKTAGGQERADTKAWVGQYCPAILCSLFAPGAFPFSWLIMLISVPESYE